MHTMNTKQQLKAVRINIINPQCLFIEDYKGCVCDLSGLYTSQSEILAMHKADIVTNLFTTSRGSSGASITSPLKQISDLAQFATVDMIENTI